MQLDLLKTSGVISMKHSREMTNRLTGNVCFLPVTATIVARIPSVAPSLMSMRIMTNDCMGSGLSSV